MQAQIVVPVHTYDRPVRRAVESVLAEPDCGVVVVAHGIRAAGLDLPKDPRVEAVEIATGVGFPGVAFNSGFDATSAPWVGIMGSDDWFEPGALRAMLDHAVKDRADGVVAPLRLAASPDNTGLPKSWRRRRLSGRKDHLYWRTSPLGIFKRDLMLREPHRFDETVRAGVDQLNSVLLWSSGARFSYYPGDPAYVVGDDAQKRVSSVAAPLSEHAASWESVWKSPHVRALPLGDRRLLAQRMLTVHVFSVVRARAEGFRWAEEDRDWLASLMELMRREAPGFDVRLPLSKRWAFDATRSGDLTRAGTILRNSSYVQNRLPSSLRAFFYPHFWLHRKLSDWVCFFRRVWSEGSLP